MKRCAFDVLQNNCRGPVVAGYFTKKKWDILTLDGFELPVDLDFILVSVGLGVVLLFEDYCMGQKPLRYKTF